MVVPRQCSSPSRKEGLGLRAYGHGGSGVELGKDRLEALTKADRAKRRALFVAARAFGAQGRRVIAPGFGVSGFGFRETAHSGTKLIKFPNSGQSPLKMPSTLKPLEAKDSCGRSSIWMTGTWPTPRPWSFLADARRIWCLGGFWRLEES